VMSSEYNITLDDKQYHVKIDRLDEGGLLVVKVGDESFTVKAEPTDDGSWLINDTTSDYIIKILRKSGSEMSIMLDDTEKSFVWERLRKQEVVKSPSASAGAGSHVKGGVYAPMPGKITEDKVAVGAHVKAGETVCILEAMKMFNELKSHQDGTVKEVNVESGSPVTPNDLLVLID
jgi:biotin carboxyl carrier protein